MAKVKVAKGKTANSNERIHTNIKEREHLKKNRENLDIFALKWITCIVRKT